MKTLYYHLLLSLLFSANVSCQTFYGTDEPFAAEAIYFLMTDRFVDGDKSNNFPKQGGKLPSFDRPLFGPDRQQANVGYLGGDFKGILDNADYIKEMGFSAIWITPIVENPDQAFNGGDEVLFNGAGDRGKAAYHGYWGVNFFKEDEHLVSTQLRFREFTQQLQHQFGLKLVLDIVCNHGSPSYDMQDGDQALFGEIYDRRGNLVADHQNLHPTNLDPDEALHSFFHREPDLAQLSNINEDNPAVLEYFSEAYLQWIEQGAAAFRIDTIRHMPHPFWKSFSDRIRDKHPGFFMFGESFNYDASIIAQHTKPENGGISVLDFPGRQHMLSTFERADSDYADIVHYLHLADNTYHNPYELVTFYDNHDVRRMNAKDEGFIDAHNWLFTSRGIPAVYYGSEIGFMAGKREHEGNRNYFGQDNIQQAKHHKIYKALKAIANIRKHSPALQRGLQLNLEFSGHRAAFLRVFQMGDLAQSALVLLNKGDRSEEFTFDKQLNLGRCTNAHNGEVIRLDSDNPTFKASVPPHGVKVFFFDNKLDNRELITQLCQINIRHCD